MKEKFFKLFKTAKPIIAMVHFPALPGSPLYDSKLGLDYILESTEKDLIALQNAGVDVTTNMSVPLFIKSLNRCNDISANCIISTILFIITSNQQIQIFEGHIFS